MTKKHLCKPGCVCKAEEIAVIFVPGIMGTRLYNVVDGKVVWDPAKGIGLYDSGVIDLVNEEAKETVEKVEQEIKIAIDGALGEVKTAVKEIGKEIGDQLKGDTVDSVHGQANLAKIVADTTAKLKVLDGQLLEAIEKKDSLIKNTQKFIAKPLGLNLSGLDKFIGPDYSQERQQLLTKINAEKGHIDNETKGILGELNKVAVKIAKVDREIKRIQGQIDQVLQLGKDINTAAQVARIGAGVFSLMSWMCADAIERKRVLVGKGSARDDNLLQIANDATIRYDPQHDKLKLFKYYGVWTSINPLKMFDYQQRGWGEVCWPMYGEFLKKLQRGLDNKLMPEPDTSSGGKIKLPTHQQEMTAGVSAVLKQVSEAVVQLGKVAKGVFSPLETLLNPSAAAATTANPAGQTDGKEPGKTQAAAKDPKGAQGQGSGKAGKAKEGDKKADQGGKQTPTDFDPYPDEQFALLMAGYKFFVYAVGYNWMQSNALSGLRLKARISQILAETNIKKVIIVSHSMGGFVTRAAVVDGIDAMIPSAGPPEGDSAGASEDRAENSAVADDITGLGSSEREQKKIAKESSMAEILRQIDQQRAAKKAATPPPKPKSWDELKVLAGQFKPKDVLAVIHGAMPTHGSPDTYARFRMGYYSPLTSPMEFITGEVLGANAAEAVAILGYCQGAQELLPNDLYQRASGGHNWLCYQVDFPQGEKQGEVQVAHSQVRPQLLFKVKGKASQVGDVMENGNTREVDSMYQVYRNMDDWFRIIDPKLLAPEYIDAVEFSIQEYMKQTRKYINSSEEFHKQLADKFLNNKTAILYSTNVNDQARDKAVWLGPATLTAADNPFSWQLKEGSIANSAGWWPLAKDKPYDDGKGTIFLTKETVAAVDDNVAATVATAAKKASPLAGLMAFKLQAGDVPGDGTVHHGAGDNLRSNKKLYTKEGGFKCGEQHSSFYSDKATFNKLKIRLKLYLGDHQSKKAAKK